MERVPSLNATYNFMTSVSIRRLLGELYRSEARVSLGFLVILGRILIMMTWSCLSSSEVLGAVMVGNTTSCVSKRGYVRGRGKCVRNGARNGGVDGEGRLSGEGCIVTPRRAPDMATTVPVSARPCSASPTASYHSAATYIRRSSCTAARSPVRFQSNHCAA